MPLRPASPACCGWAVPVVPVVALLHSLSLTSQFCAEWSSKAPCCVWDRNSSPFALSWVHTPFPAIPLHPAPVTVPSPVRLDLPWSRGQCSGGYDAHVSSWASMVSGLLLLVCPPTQLLSTQHAVVSVGWLGRFFRLENGSAHPQFRGCLLSLPSLAPSSVPC